MSLLTMLGGIFGITEDKPNIPQLDSGKPNNNTLCIGHIKGHNRTKICLLIAAAGRHNVLLLGPPGEGKSSIISTIPGFLPRITNKEFSELEYIFQHSNEEFNYSSIRPFVEVGPNITESGLLGGGRKPYPGYISLAHSGILFMDELPQFDRKLIEQLRTPLERKEIVVTRNGESIKYPCNFQLICAMNPCPCGYYGSGKCTCTDSQRQRYLAKLSGPILDRIDIFQWLDKITTKDKFSGYIENQSAKFRTLVENSILFRLNHRQQKYFNGDIPSKDIYTNNNILHWSNSGLELFKSRLDNISTRKGVRLARLSRTMADVLGHKYIEPKHIYMVENYISLPGIKE